MRDPHRHGGPKTWTMDGARSPSHAERVHTLLAAETSGNLSTALVAQPDLGLDGGYPFGSIVDYALDARGRPLLLMSNMAPHVANVTADPRSSLLVTASAADGGRIAAARATLVGTCARLEGAEDVDARERYAAAHPDAFWISFPDFAMFRLDVDAVRYVRGFGEMSWVQGSEHLSASPDPVEAAQAGIVDHMNEDHHEHLVLVADALLETGGTVTKVEMLGCDRHGFDVRMQVDGELAFGRLGFPSPLSEPGEARQAMVDLVGRARAAVGG